MNFATKKLGLLLPILVCNAMVWLGCNSPIQKPKPNTSEKRYNVKLMHPELETYKDTLVTLDYLNNHLETFSAFNYPKLKLKNSSTQQITLANKNFRVVIETAPFLPKNNTITYAKDANTVLKINNKTPWGTDGNLPTKGIERIVLIKKSDSLEVPRSYFDDLYQPNTFCVKKDENLCYTAGYLSPENELILTMQNSDGAGSYLVVFILHADGSVAERIVGHQF